MNAIKKLFNIEFPIVQAGMVWCSGWRLASEVSNAGGLGLIGAGSMGPDLLREHIRKCKQATSKPFGVNVPLLYRDIDRVFEILVEEKVDIVFTSAGDPSKWTTYLKENQIKVVHVIANKKFALKAEKSGVDAIVAEGFEAGGHNGREETTTMCLIPEICDSVRIPVIAAGGIGSGRAMLAAFALGAEGVQVGSLFAASKESSAHDNFKRAIINSNEGDTKLSMKSLIPVRLMKNDFFHEVEKAEANGATRSDLMELLGKGRAKAGMFEGDLDAGELEIGQIASSIREIKPARDILMDLWQEFISEKERIRKMVV
ncbi:NAD(P)H-dependent flavin oxidoreductase [Daejeonella lutea]|uniref:Enoyl-[acyl-carrier protein] reductase II n=1 Tax=Daejeonella lutea TaxID=572036 RepID=A0A1T5E793_9SPHI|nr:nitronate monooxygenase [Daejeonella lutea]SKB79690.1 enoyl-[acyl-carrier protein] reductase II [Daejeonella lutea]